MSQLLINKITNEEQELNENNDVVTNKIVTLQGKVVDENTGDALIHLRTTLTGDGSTPETVMFGGKSTVIGYRDDGSPILNSATESERKASLKKFRARAIKEQKALTKENGIDPSVVNNYGDEDKAKENK